MPSASGRIFADRTKRHTTATDRAAAVGRDDTNGSAFTLSCPLGSARITHSTPQGAATGRKHTGIHTARWSGHHCSGRQCIRRCVRLRSQSSLPTLAPVFNLTFLIVVMQTRSSLPAVRILSGNNPLEGPNGRLRLASLPTLWAAGWCKVKGRPILHQRLGCKRDD